MRSHRPSLRSANLGWGNGGFTLPEGGTWQSTEALTSIPREGQAMMIKRGIAGGYMLKIGQGAAAAG